MEQTTYLIPSPNWVRHNTNVFEEEESLAPQGWNVSNVHFWDPKLTGKMRNGILRVLFCLIALGIVVLTPSEKIGPQTTPNALVLAAGALLISTTIFLASGTEHNRLIFVFDTISVIVSILYVCHLFILLPGLPFTHDLHHYIPQIEAVRGQIRRGEFLPRWSHVFWCGVPFSRFLQSPLIFACSAMLFFIGTVSITKVLVVSIYLVSSYSIYITSSRTFQSKSAGTWAAITYATSGYHLIDSHIRGNLAELSTFMWIPLAYFFLQKTLAEKCWSKSSHLSMVLGSLSISMTLIAHPPTGLLLVGWLSVLIVWTIGVQRRTDSKRLAKMVTLACLQLIGGIGFSAWYLMPALFERGFVTLGIRSIGASWWYSFTIHLVEPAHFFERSYGWHSSPKMPLYLGNVIVFSSLCSVFFLRHTRIERSKISFLLISTVLFLLLPTTFVADIYTFLTRGYDPISGLVKRMLDEIIVFPWRIMTLYCFTSSTLSGYVISKINYSSEQKLTRPRYVTYLLTLMILTAILVDTFPYTGYVGGYESLEISKDALEACDWIERQPGIFRVFFANYEEKFYYIYANGYSIPVIGPAPYSDGWRPIISLKLVDKALDELSHSRWLWRASYLSIRYIVVDQDDIRRWNGFVSKGILGVVAKFDSTIVLKNHKSRPYIEVAYNKEDIGAPTVPAEISIHEFKSECLSFEVEITEPGNFFLTIKENYYPNWSATVDGENIKLLPSKNGLMLIPIRQGKHQVKITYSTSVADYGSLGISLLTVVLLAVAPAKLKLPSKRKRPKGAQDVRAIS